MDLNGDQHLIEIVNLKRMNKKNYFHGRNFQIFIHEEKPQRQLRHLKTSLECSALKIPANSDAAKRASHASDNVWTIWMLTDFSVLLLREHIRDAEIAHVATLSPVKITFHLFVSSTLKNLRKFSFHKISWKDRLRSNWCRAERECVAWLCAVNWCENLWLKKRWN